MDMGKYNIFIFFRNVLGIYFFILVNIKDFFKQYKETVENIKVVKLIL